MRLTKRRRSARPDMNMTPMIDIVFLLLIFFMTVSQISEINREPVALPQLTGSEDQRPTVLIVNVTRDGRLRISGTDVTIAGLVSIVERELFERGGDRGLLSVVIRADRRSTSRMTNEVVRTLGQLGIVQVRFAVEADE